MTAIQWDSPASLVRVTRFATADPQEEQVARATVRELVGTFLEMTPAEQRDLMIRAAGPSWIQEFDEAAIRELAARPEFTGAEGFFDTARLGEDPDVEEEIDVLVTESGSSDASTAPPDSANDTR